MTVSVTALARTRRFTSLESVKQSMGLGLVAHPDDLLFDALIEQATSVIQLHTRRDWARATLSETLPGYGDVELMMTRTPVLAVTEVLCDADPITDFTLDDPEAGILFRRAGWGWTAQLEPGLTGRQRWPGFGSPIPGSEERRYTVAYVAGYLLADQDLLGRTTISAVAADNSINDSASAFPPDLRAGETVLVSGFANAANNGRFIVAEAPTAGKVKLTAALVDEAAGPAVSVRFDPPAAIQPRNRVLERATNETVKSWNAMKTRDGGLVESRVGPVTERREVNPMHRGLPPAVVGLLSSLERAA